jgi:hypothetical protein
MSKILDDFFGDSNAQPECLFCGKRNGNLLPEISDNNGITHWAHADCKADYQARKAVEDAQRKAHNDLLNFIGETDN